MANVPVCLYWHVWTPYQLFTYPIHFRVEMRACKWLCSSQINPVGHRLIFDKSITSFHLWNCHLERFYSQLELEPGHSGRYVRSYRRDHLSTPRSRTLSEEVTQIDPLIQRYSSHDRPHIPQLFFPLSIYSLSLIDNGSDMGRFSHPPSWWCTPPYI